MIFNFSQYKVYERLGVPHGIIEVGNLLYDEILTILRKNKTKLLSRLPSFPLNTIQINDCIINDMILNIEFIDNDDEFSFESFGTESPLGDLGEYHITRKIDGSSINLTMSGNSDTLVQELLDFFIEDEKRARYALTHELKHIYDQCKHNKTEIDSLSSYQIFMTMRFDIDPLDELFELIYYFTQTESKVRASQLAAEVMNKEITKKEFKEFFKKTIVYKTHIDGIHLNYEQFMREMKVERSNINRLLKGKGAKIDFKDPEIVNKFLNSIAKSISNKKMKLLNNMILHLRGKANYQELGEKDIKFLTDKMNDFSRNSPNEFYKYWINYVNVEAKKSLRKISKVYDLCKD